MDFRIASRTFPFTPLQSFSVIPWFSVSSVPLSEADKTTPHCSRNRR